MALINFRNALMAGTRLPYDAELEYLESTGTQYINTGVYADNETAVELLCKYTQAFQDNAVISMDAGNNQTRAFTIKMYNGRIYFSFSDTMTQNASLQSSWNQISASQNGLIVNGDSVSVSQAPAFQCEYPLFMFCYGRKGVPIIYGKWQIASCKIYQNGVLVRDFIPVRVGTVGYLYDRVSGKLFGNAGTGDFVLGPDVVPVEYIESHGTEWIDTGINALSTTDFDFEITARFPSVPSAGYFGSGYTSSSGVQMFYAINAIATTGLYMACNSTTTIASNLSADKTSWHSARAVSKDGIVRYYFDGVQVSSFASSAFTLPHLYLFAFSDTGGNAIGLGPNQISSFRFSANDTPLCSFLPVRIGTDATSWEGAMMDTLTRRIYRNAGTGAFGYGNDLKYPIPA